MDGACHRVSASRDPANWYAECDVDSRGILLRYGGGADVPNLTATAVECWHKCLACSRCRYISFDRASCFWYSDCDTSKLHDSAANQEFQTALVRGPHREDTPLPAPRVRSCDELSLPAVEEERVWLVDRPSGVALVAAPKAGSTEASLIMFRALGLLGVARAYTRPVRSAHVQRLKPCS